MHTIAAWKGWDRLGLFRCFQQRSVVYLGRHICSGSGVGNQWAWDVSKGPSIGAMQIAYCKCTIVYPQQGRNALWTTLLNACRIVTWFRTYTQLTCHCCPQWTNQPSTVRFDPLVRKHNLLDTFDMSLFININNACALPCKTNGGPSPTFFNIWHVKDMSSIIPSFFTPFNCNPMSDLVFANVFSFSFDITWYNITHPIPRKYARTEFWQDMRKIMKSSTCKLDQICCPSFANFEFHLRIASSKKALKEAGSRHLLVIPYQALHQFDLDSFAFLVAIIFFGKCLFCDYPPDPMYNLVASPHLPPRVQCPLNYNEPFDVLPRHHLILAGKNGAPDLAWVAWMKYSCWMEWKRNFEILPCNPGGGGFG